MTDNSQSVAFYAAIRKDGAALSRLAGAESEAELIERIMDEATSRGFTLTEGLVKSALADIGGLVRQTTAGEELADFELELVSGGFESAWDQYNRAEQKYHKCF